MPAVSQAAVSGAAIPQAEVSWAAISDCTCFGWIGFAWSSPMLVFSTLIG